MAGAYDDCQRVHDPSTASRDLGRRRRPESASCASDAHRRRRLPGAQRGDPRHRAQGRAPLRRRAGRLPRRLAGVLEDATTSTSTSSACGARCRGAAPCSARRAPTRSRSTAASSGVEPTLAELGHRRAHRDRRRGHARRRPPNCLGHGVQVVGVPKTIDNDLVGHRAHLRLRHRGADRHRRHRPAAHHGRVPRPGDGGRGHGPPRRPHRHVGRHRRRRHHDPDPRGAVRHRRGVRRASSAATRRGRYASIVVVAEGAAAQGRAPSSWQPSELDEFGHVRLGGIANILAAEIGRAPASRRGSRSSATCSAAARPPRSTGCCRPASASPPSTPCTTATSARWWRCARPDRAACPLQEAVGELKLVDPELYHGVAAEFFAG